MRAPRRSAPVTVDGARVELDHASVGCVGARRDDRCWFHLVRISERSRPRWPSRPRPCRRRRRVSHRSTAHRTEAGEGTAPPMGHAGERHRLAGGRRHSTCRRCWLPDRRIDASCACEAGRSVRPATRRALAGPGQAMRANQGRWASVAVCHPYAHRTSRCAPSRPYAPARMIGPTEVRPMSILRYLSTLHHNCHYDVRDFSWSTWV